MDLMITYKDVIIQIAQQMLRGFAVAAIALAAVYIIGRMLELTKSNRIKNLIALLVIILGNYGYAAYVLTLSEVDLALNVIIYAAESTIIYVLVGFSLYNRVDSFLDRRFGDNDSKPATTRKPRTKKPAK